MLGFEIVQILVCETCLIVDADDSDIMRGDIVRLLKDKPRIKVVAEAVSFAKIIQLRKHA